MDNYLTVYGGNTSATAANPSKGTEIFEAMLLSQYEDSPNLKEYIGAYVSELDLLFEQIEEVYLGRMLDRAVGAQLDVIGKILNQDRTVALPTVFFGMSNDGVQEVLMDKLANEVESGVGGLFKDEAQAGFSVVPLDDVKFRRLLLAKAYLSTKPTVGIEDMYFAIATLLGRVPRLMQLYTSASASNALGLNDRDIQLQISIEDTDNGDLSFLEYFSPNMVPLGTTFNVIRL